MKIGTLRNPYEDITISFVNEEEMPRYAVWLLARTLGERGEALEGAKVALVGIVDLDEIADENPALEIREELLKNGAIVVSDENSFFPQYADTDARIIATDPSTFRIEI